MEKRHDSQPIEQRKAISIQCHAGAGDPDPQDAVVHEGAVGFGPAARGGHGLLVLAHFHRPFTAARHSTHSTPRPRCSALIRSRMTTTTSLRTAALLALL